MDEHDNLDHDIARAEGEGMVSSDPVDVLIEQSKHLVPGAPIVHVPIPEHDLDSFDEPVSHDPIAEGPPPKCCRRMTATMEFCPNWASAPGDTIADLLEERGWSISEFAGRLGETNDQARQLLQGRATITVGTARKLEKVLGGTAEFWMARDFQFREDVDRIHRLDQEWA